MTSSRYARITAQIVAAYVSNNHVARADLAGVVDQVIGTLGQLSDSGAPAQAPEPQPLVPAVPIRKSIEPDFIVCLEDGKRFRSLKRHLATKFGLSPDEYRRKWGLPADYPMVAPNYAAARSQMAKTMGLGRKAAVAVLMDTAEAAIEVADAGPSGADAVAEIKPEPVAAEVGVAEAAPKKRRGARKETAEPVEPVKASAPAKTAKAATKRPAAAAKAEAAESPTRKRAPRKAKTAA